MIYPRYCEHCNQTYKECDKTSCPGKREREYFRDLHEWESSPNWVSEPPY